MPLSELRLRQKTDLPASAPYSGRSASAAAPPLDSSKRSCPCSSNPSLSNGVRRQVLVNADDSLANVLRDQLQLTSVKLGCEKGSLAAPAASSLNGKLTRTCVLKMKRVPDDATIITLEGIGKRPIICIRFRKRGYFPWRGPGAASATPGLHRGRPTPCCRKTPRPPERKVRDWFQKNRNVCRCTGYIPIIKRRHGTPAPSLRRATRTLRKSATRNLPKVITSAPPKPRPSGRGQGDRHRRIRRRPPPFHMPANTLHLALAQAKGFPCQHQRHRHLRSRKDARRVPCAHPQRRQGARTASPALITFPDNKGDGWDRPILKRHQGVPVRRRAGPSCAPDTECHARAAAEKGEVRP